MLANWSLSLGRSMHALVIVGTTTPQMTAKMMIEAFQFIILQSVICIMVFILFNNFPVCFNKSSKVYEVLVTEFLNSYQSDYKYLHETCHQCDWRSLGCAIDHHCGCSKHLRATLLQNVR